jgi:hypothetical protein
MCDQYPDLPDISESLQEQIHEGFDVVTGAATVISQAESFVTEVVSAEEEVLSQAETIVAEATAESERPMRSKIGRYLLNYFVDYHNAHTGFLTPKDMIRPGYLREGQRLLFQQNEKPKI